jgi:hypothetical protein
MTREVSDLRIRVLHFAGSPFVAGATLGSSVLAQSSAAIGTLGDSVIYLDFDGIEVATGSFLRESVLGLRDFCQRSSKNLTLVVANANELVTEELSDLLTRLRDAILGCRLSENNTPSQPTIVGQLEDAQRRTLAAVLEVGVADASTLSSRHSDDFDKIGPTGWNNRLAALAAKGILREARRGRAKSYKPTVEGLTLGS